MPPNNMSRYAKALIERNGGFICHYCHKPLRKNESGNCAYGHDVATIDHMTPRARGGKDNLNNVVLACWECNMKKGKRTYVEFMLDMMGKRKEK